MTAGVSRCCPDVSSSPADARSDNRWIDAGQQAYLASGITLDHVEAGDRARPTVLLIMGMTGQRILWPRELVAALVDAGLHVVAFDHRDVGRSSILEDAPVDLESVTAAMSGHAFDAPYGLADMAADALGLLDHLEVERAHVVGVSMGGMIAQHLAIDHAERVASLTSINSSPGIAPPTEPVHPLVVIPDPTPPTDAEAFVDWFVDGLAEHRAHRVILDLLEPWSVLDAAAAALPPGGVVLSYTPTVPQVMRFTETLWADGRFANVATTETLVRGWDVDGLAVRPKHRMVAHTAFLTTARRVPRRDEGGPPPPRRKADAAEAHVTWHDTGARDIATPEAGAEPTDLDDPVEVSGTSEA